MPEFLIDINRMPLEAKIYVDKSVAIAEKIIKRIEELGLTQKELADRMGKTEAEISRGLAGEQNLTLRSICKFEAALNFTIIELKSTENDYQVLAADLHRKNTLLESRNTKLDRDCEELKKENSELAESLVQVTKEKNRRINELEKGLEKLKLFLPYEQQSEAEKLLNKVL